MADDATPNKPSNGVSVIDGPLGKLANGTRTHATRSAAASPFRSSPKRTAAASASTKRSAPSSVAELLERLSTRFRIKGLPLGEESVPLVLALMERLEHTTKTWATQTAELQLYKTKTNELQQQNAALEKKVMKQQKEITQLKERNGSAVGKVERKEKHKEQEESQEEDEEETERTREELKRYQREIEKLLTERELILGKFRESETEKEKATKKLEKLLASVQAFRALAAERNKQPNHETTQLLQECDQLRQVEQRLKAELAHYQLEHGRMVKELEKERREKAESLREAEALTEQFRQQSEALKQQQVGNNETPEAKKKLKRMKEQVKHLNHTVQDLQGKLQHKEELLRSWMLLDKGRLPSRSTKMKQKEKENLWEEEEGDEEEDGKSKWHRGSMAENKKLKEQVTDLLEQAKTFEANMKLLQMELEESSVLLDAKEKQIQYLLGGGATSENLSPYSYNSKARKKWDEEDITTSENNSFLKTKKMAAKLKKLETSLEESEQKIAALTHENKQLEKRLKQHNPSDHSKREQQRQSGKQQDLYELRIELDSLKHEHSLQRDLLELKESELRKLGQRLESLTEAHAKLQRKYQDLEILKASLESELNDSKTEAARTTQLLKTLSHERGGAHEEMEKLHKRHSHTELLLKRKEEENEQLLLNNRRLSDSNAFLTQDNKASLEENHRLSSNIQQLQDQLFIVEDRLKEERNHRERLQAMLESEKEKVELTDQMREKLNLLIQRSEMTGERVKALVHTKEKQEAEITKLRQEAHELLRERDQTSEREKQNQRNFQYLQNTVQLQKEALSLMEEEKAKLHEFVCKYEAALHACEQKLEALTKEFVELERHVVEVEQQNVRLEGLLRRVYDNLTDREQLRDQFNALIRTNPARLRVQPGGGSASATPVHGSLSGSHMPQPPRSSPK